MKTNHMKPKTARKKVVSRFPGRQRLNNYQEFYALPGLSSGPGNDAGQDIIDFFSGFPDTMGPSDTKNRHHRIEACHSCIDDEGLYLTAEEVLYLEA